jgi:hypothetical protein
MTMKAADFDDQSEAILSVLRSVGECGDCGRDEASHLVVPDDEGNATFVCAAWYAGDSRIDAYDGGGNEIRWDGTDDELDELYFMIDEWFTIWVQCETALVRVPGQARLGLYSSLAEAFHAVLGPPEDPSIPALR